MSTSARIVLSGLPEDKKELLNEIKINSKFSVFSHLLIFVKWTMMKDQYSNQLCEPRYQRNPLVLEKNKVIGYVGGVISRKDIKKLFGHSFRYMDANQSPIPYKGKLYRIRKFSNENIKDLWNVWCIYDINDGISIFLTEKGDFSTVNIPNHMIVRRKKVPKLHELDELPCFHEKFSNDTIEDSFYFPHDMVTILLEQSSSIEDNNLL